VLTDYHVHLRPDETDATPERFFTTANAERYRVVAEERGIQELGVAEHVYRFHDALDVWDHPLWRQFAADDLEEYVAFVREDTDLRLGIEADFIPGREDRMGALLERHRWDYVLGSVHFVREHAVDMAGAHDIWGRGESPDRIWSRYFEWVARAALTGQFDIMAHPDLVKYWGGGRPAPDRDLRFYYEPAIEAFAEAGVAVEVSTAGLRKPAGEIYPSRAFLEMALDAGLPLALSSDAHEPQDLGYEYERALELLDELGVKELCVFEGRARRLEPIG
jgi:histidinol-phosphatase (PHP family)